MKYAWLAVAIAACSASEHRAAREQYDEGLDLLAKPDYAAAEAALIKARNEAGVDPELRFRAAYNLGIAYAAHAEQTKSGKDADPGKALELEQEAVSWLFDAQRLRPDDADTKVNLAIARARASALSDQLSKGENKLEHRIDAVIGEQRHVLDDSRTAWLAIKQQRGADPLAQQGPLVHQADQERGIVAEVGVIGDLAADEIDSIGKKPEDKRSEDEKVRVVQLKNLDIYVLDARSKLAEARSKLQDLDAEGGVGRAEAALVALKRAREQLLDPVTVLRELGRDELELAQETHTVAEHEAGGSLLQPDATKANAPLPAWLAPAPLAERQDGLRARIEEVRTRLQAAGGGDDPKATDEQKAMLARVAAALPHVAAASGAMEHARDAIAASKLDEAAKAERDVVIELAKAIEEFAELKQLVDLAAETGHRVVDLLSPEAAKQLKPAERSTETMDALSQNATRLGRIGELIAEATAKLDKAPPPSDPKQADAQKQQVEAQKQQLAAAAVLRGDAEKALGQLDAAIKANKDAQGAAKEAAAKLDELRRLFFSVIEHLEELIRQQGETRDQTTAADGEDDFTRAPKLPALASRETEHGTMAKAIADALAAQADAAAKQPQGQQAQPGQPNAKQLTDATAEIRLGQGEIADATVALDKAQSKTQSVTLKPAITSEGKALEHLENALKILQPPKQQNKNDDKQQQQQQQQGGAGQSARDNDAKRQRERNRGSGTDPVEQDW